MKRMKELLKHKRIIFVALQLLALGAWMFAIINYSGGYNSVMAGNTLDKFRSDYITFQDDHWYIDQEMAANMGIGGVVNLLYGPYLALEEGSYVLNIDYDCNVNQSFLPYAPDGKDKYIKTQTGILDKNLEHVSYHFDTTEQLENFEVQIKYNGEGYLRINRIEIEKDMSAAKRRCFLFAMGLCILDCFVFAGEWLKKHRGTILALIGMTLLLSIPVFSKGIYNGHDFRFHTMRIEGIMYELRAGHIPVRISSLWAAGYGYPVSIYYGDILLYVPAILRLLGFTIVGAYKAYVVMINGITVVVSYLCFRKMFRRENIALLCSLIYGISTYRLMDVYIRSAVGEYSAMAFLPLIALAVYNIYVDDVKNFRQYVKNATVLALGMSGVIETHVLSTEMVVFILALLCIVLWKKTFRPNTIKVYLIAIAETVLFNLFFLYPFWDYYNNVTVRINNIVDNSNPKQIQSAGAYLLQYFSFFQNPFGNSSVTLAKRMAMTPGIAMMAALVAAVFLWGMGKADRRMKITTIFSAFVLFLASDLFPWNHFALSGRIGAMLAQVQFPWRYIGIANIFLAVLAGLVAECLLREYKDTAWSSILIPLTAAVGISFLFVFVSQYCEDEWVAEYRDTAELDFYYCFMASEYVRPISNSTNVGLAALGKSLITENMNAATVVDRQGTDMTVYCETGETPGRLTLPIFNYMGYHVRDDYGGGCIVTDGPECRISFKVPANFAGNLYITFEEPWEWRLAEIISGLSIAGYILYTIFRKKGIGSVGRCRKLFPEKNVQITQKD